MDICPPVADNLVPEIEILQQRHPVRSIFLLSLEKEQIVARFPFALMLLENFPVGLLPSRLG